MKPLIENIIDSNDQESWNKLIEMTHKDLLSQANRLLPFGDLHQDALQETFISIYKNLQKFYLQNKKFEEYDFTINFSKWSRTIVRNKALNLIKQQKNQIKLIEKNHNAIEKIKGQIKDNKKESFELKEYLHQMLSSLKQKDHKLLALKYFEGMTNLEISTETGYQIKSIPVLINRALGQLRKRFEHAGLVIAAATLTEVLAHQQVTTTVTTSIPPEVFHSIKSIPSRIGISTVTLKGLLMKSLLILISATVLCISILHLQSNAENQNNNTKIKKDLISINDIINNERVTNETPLLNENQAIKQEQTNNNQKQSVKNETLYGLENSTSQNTLFNLKKFNHNFQKTAFGKIWSDKTLKSQLSSIDWKVATPELLDMVHLNSTFFTETELNILREVLTLVNEIHIETKSGSFLLRLKINEDFKQSQLKIKKMISDLSTIYSNKHNDTVKNHDDRLKIFLKEVTITGKIKSVSTVYESKIKTLDSLNYKSEGPYFYIYKGKLIEIEKPNKEINNQNLFSKAQTKPAKYIGGFGIERVRHPFLHTDESIMTYKTSIENGMFKEQTITTNVDSQGILKLFTKNIEEEGFNKDQKKRIYAAINLNINPFLNWAKGLSKTTKIPDAMFTSIAFQIKNNMSGEVFFSHDAENAIYYIKSISRVKASSLITMYSLIVGPYGIKLENGPNSWIKISIPNKSFSEQEFDFSIKNHLAIAYYPDKETINSLSSYLYSITMKYQHLEEYKELIKPSLTILTQRLYLKYFGQSKFTMKKEGKNILFEHETSLPFVTLSFFVSHFKNLNHFESIKVKKNLGEKVITILNISEDGIKTNNQLDLKSYDNNKKHGVWKISDHNEKPFREFTYIEDKKTGPEKRYFSNGKLSHFITYKNGLKNGSYKRFHINGNLKTQGSFEDDKKCKLWTHYFSNGKIKKTGEYSENCKKGVWQHFTTSGEELMKLNYSIGSKFPLQSSSYHLNGAPKFSIDTVDQIKTLKQYNEKSTLIRVSRYFQNRRVGLWQEFSTDSTLLNQWEYKMEFITKRKSFFKNGNINKLINYENKMYSGKQFHYHSNGKLKNEIIFSLNLPIPSWKSYNEEGKIIGEWSNDGKFSGILNRDYISKIMSDFNIFASQGQDAIDLDLTGIKPSSYNIITPLSIFRGRRLEYISDQYGNLLDNNSIRNSLLFQEYHHETPGINEFIDDTMGAEKNYFLMDKKVLIKLCVKKQNVFEQDYIELKNHMFE